MAKMKIAKLRNDVKPNSFTCGNQSVNTQIYKSYYPTILQHGYAYSISYEDISVGYYMISFLKISLPGCPESISEYSSDLYDYCFSIHIKYIAVEENQQKQGIGKSLIKYIIKNTKMMCDTMPIRLVTLDALKSKYEWYTKCGFIPFNEKNLEDQNETILMYFDCLLDRRIVDEYIENNIE